MKIADMSGCNINGGLSAGLIIAALCCIFAAGSGWVMAQAESRLTLTVKPIRGANDTVTAIEVREVLTGETQNGALLSMKAALSAITVQHIADSITNLQVMDSHGNIPLTTSNDPPVTNYDSAYRHWRAERPTTFPVTISYRIPTELLPTHGPPLGMVAAGKGVAGNGIGFLLLPENTTSERTQMKWDLSDMPHGSVGVITAGAGTVDVPGPPSEMTKQWILAGPATRINADRPSGFHGYLAGDAPFDGKEMLEFGDKAYSTLGTWFQYLSLPNYNLFIRALSGPSFGTGTAGEGRGGSLINVGATYWQGQDRTYIQSVIFHEMTHQWVGLIKGRASWFEEGLTVYVTATLPCQAHLLRLSDCVGEFNRTIRSYYTSEGRNWSQQKINDSPFLHEDIREVPYGRGALYFASLNAQLMMKSRGQRGLKAALYPLFVARREGKGFDQADFEAMLRRELGPHAVDDFRQEMIDGAKEIVPPSDIFGPCFARVSVTLTPNDGRVPVQGYEWREIA